MRNTEYKRKRSPIILLVCEGKNKSERKYFSHFQERDTAYRLIIKDSEATDVLGMAKRAKNLYAEYQMDSQIGDHAFCLVDLDLRTDKYLSLLQAKKRFPTVEFIVSNPCFEVWLLYYFSANPKAETSSKSVKEQLKKYIPEYEEALDVYAQYSLHDKHSVAVERSKFKNGFYDVDSKVVDRNPYTEIANLILMLKKIDTEWR